MKKNDLKKLALLGLASGIVLSHVEAGEASKNHQIQISSLLAANTSKAKSNLSDQSQPDPNEGNLGYHLMTEEELLLELNEEGQRMYNAMDPANKKLARDVASGRCANTNYCQGLNACKTEKNACAGQASCKGNGKCGISDKNLAVRLVYNKMMKKRAAANGSE